MITPGLGTDTMVLVALLAAVTADLPAATSEENVTDNLLPAE